MTREMDGTCTAYCNFSEVKPKLQGQLIKLLATIIGMFQYTYNFIEGSYGRYKNEGWAYAQWGSEYRMLEIRIHLNNRHMIV